MIKFYIKFILIYIIIQSVDSIDGPNVCIESNPQTNIVTVTEAESFQVTTRKWCMKLPSFRCTHAETRYRTVSQQRTVSVIKSEDKCCAGYDLEEDKCVPICAEACLNGKCISPDNCECEEGYFGKTCDICIKCGSQCPEGTYGLQCENKCNCHNNATCDTKLGACTCTEGWRDEDCNTPCPKGYFGLNCTEKCDRNETICDHVTGKNICRDGYIGNYCEEPCSKENYGKDCTQLCTCKNDAVCDVENGKCECKPGWQGSNCDMPCEQGKFGSYCEQDCLCSKESLCSPTDGQCRCIPGWRGTYCTEKCTYGYYGDHCATPCNCGSGNFVCDHIEGCKCPDNFIGEQCDVNINDKYVPVMEEDISSDNNNNYLVLSIIMTVLLIVIVISIIIIGLFYYRKKRRSIREVLQVRYTANSFAQNSLYSLQEHNQVNNCHQIVNNWRTENNYTTDNIRPCTSSNETENEYSELLMKNLDADKSNPNINKHEPAKYINMNRISEEPDIVENIYENIDTLKN